MTAIEKFLMEKSNNTFPKPGVEPRTFRSAVIFATTTPTSHAEEPYPLYIKSVYPSTKEPRVSTDLFSSAALLQVRHEDPPPGFRVATFDDHDAQAGWTLEHSA